MTLKAKITYDSFEINCYTENNDVINDKIK